MNKNVLSTLSQIGIWKYSRSLGEYHCPLAQDAAISLAFLLSPIRQLV
jgi:hypothetical protein